MKKYLNTFWAHLLIVLLMGGICVWFITERNWLWLCIGIPALAWAVWNFHRFYNGHTRKVAFLLDAIENNDPSIHFHEQASDNDSSKINALLNRIAGILYNVKQETIQREKYYELILDSVETGIVVLDNKGAVFQKNRKALKLLGLEILTHVRQLSTVSETLESVFAQSQPGQSAQVEYSTERGTMNLSLHVSEIIIRENRLRIIVMNDINHELDEREIDTWVRLIRVLTHEMMNSITPVTSLSETLLHLPGAQADKELHQGLETIHTTSKGLLNFVMSYRKLTRLPIPEPALFDVHSFLKRMVQIAKHQQPSPNIRISITDTPEDLMAFADENMLAQVMANLLKNAIQAIGDVQEGEIRIHAFCDEQETVRIEISNNGPRIAPEIAAQIFVPFFTTKEEGSGIGLSLSKQIMRLNGGTLSLLPYQPGKGWTTFVLTIN